MATTRTVHRPDAGFQMALAELRSMPWRTGMTIEEIGSPQRIAPHSVAIAADLMENGEELSSGRLILLHDPAGNDAWSGTFRLVSLVQADLDLEMVADPLLPDVAWSWLTDSLEHHAPGHTALAGTVTASYGRSFGDMPDKEDQGEIEIRSSWTPTLDHRGAFSGHLAAWQDLLGHVGGRPPTPAGVIRFPSGR